VLSDLRCGLTNREVALTLALSLKTVELHTTHAVCKAGGLQPP
jgi:DNA-binding NarL/FixJ family response regulator